MLNSKNHIIKIITTDTFRSVTITALTFLMSALGFLSYLLLAKVFGIGSEIDAFLYAISIPLFIASLLTAYFTYGIVPILMQSDNICLSSSQLIVIACLLACIFFFVSIIYKIDATIFLFSSFRQLNGEARLVSIAWIIGGFQVILGSLSSIFNANRFFIIPVLLQTLTPIGFLVGALATIGNENIYFPLIGMLAGIIVAIIIGIIILWNFLVSFLQLSFKNTFKLIRGNAGLFTTLMASSVFAVYPIIDAHLAPNFGIGALSTLGYAHRLIIGFGNIAVIGVFLISGPKFADTLLNNGIDQFQIIVRKSINTVLVLAATVGLLLWYYSELLINFIFGEKVQAGPLISLLPIMLVGMVPMLSSSILLRAAFCIKSLRGYIFLFGMGVPVVYLIFCLVLSPIGLLSFGYAYLISWIFGFSVLFVALFLRPSRIV